MLFRSNGNGSPLSNLRNASEHIDCTPPDFILPGSHDRPLLPLHLGTLASNNIKDKMACLKVLTTSAWNPPPGQRRMHGDLMYIFVITLEDKRVHITASPRGFYVNQTTEEVFNPKPVAQAYLSHSLVDLLSQLSPSFKKNFAQLQKIGRAHV